MLQKTVTNEFYLWLRYHKTHLVLFTELNQNISGPQGKVLVNEMSCALLTQD